MRTLDVTDLEFLRSLPINGGFRLLLQEELDRAFNLHTEKLCCTVRGETWPQTLACITFEGRKVLAKQET